MIYSTSVSAVSVPGNMKFADLQEKVRVYFNWGYHDGAFDSQHKRQQLAFVCWEYELGYRMGTEDYLVECYEADSTEAWNKAIAEGLINLEDYNG